jgi:PAS domain S-box-containing protein
VTAYDEGLQAETAERLDRLRREPDFLATVTNATAALMCVVDSDGRVDPFGVNSSFAKSIGFDDPELVGRPLCDVIGCEADLREALAEATESGVSATRESAWLTRHGPEIVVTWSCRRLPRTDDAFLVAGVDITAQKRQEVELRAERDFIRTVVDAAPAFFCVLEADGRIERFNDTLAETARVVDDERARGRQFWEVFVDAEDRAAVEAAISERAPGQLEHRWCEGRVVAWHVTLLPAQKLLVSGVDVTDRKRAERDVERQAEFLSAVGDSTPSVLVVMDDQGRIGPDGLNRAARDLFGYDSATVGRELFWKVFMRPEDRADADAAVRSAVAGEEPAERDTVWVARDGTERLIAWTCRLMPDIVEGGHIVLVSGVDVTERRRMLDEQAALRRVATLVAEGTPADELLTAVTQEVAQLFQGEAAQLVRYESQHTMTVVGGWRDSGDLSFPIGTVIELAGDSAAVRVLRTGEPSRVEDYAVLEGELAHRLAHDAGIRSSVAAPIVVDGALWGAIAVSRARPSDFAAGDELRLARFAELVGQAIANAQANQELRASRARIVEAGDAERKRLERNLHDGAQQRLVSLSLALRLAEAKLKTDPDAVAELLSSSATELSLALEELRELARGLHPAVLTDVGLHAALTGLATRSTVPVELDLALDARLPESVEAALFYVAAESLTNVAKYASASVARVRISADGTTVAIEVEDDGVGGADPSLGSGIRGLADRVEALDGWFRVQSSPDGTVVRAEIPIPQDTPAAVA